LVGIVAVTVSTIREIRKKIKSHDSVKEVELSNGGKEEVSLPAKEDIDAKNLPKLISL